MRAPEYHWIVGDIESAPRDGIAEFLEEPKAPSNWKDHVLIATEIERKRLLQIAQVSLDPNLCRIVSIGYQTESMAKPRVHLCKTEEDERDSLEVFWHLQSKGNDGQPFRTFVGFCNGTFDALVMVQRSRLLGLTVPGLEIRRYNNSDIRDLYRELAFPEVPHTSVMAETLENFCRLFGIEVQDDIDGSQIADLVAHGFWEHVAAHNEACVKRIVALARAIGAIYVPSTEPAEVI
jgi:hypothetical protein